MPPENDKNAPKAKHTSPPSSESKTEAKEPSSYVNLWNGSESRAWIWLMVAAVAAAIVIVSCIILLKTTSISEAKRLNQCGLEKFGRHDYEGAIADYTSALNNPKATIKDKSTSLYFMATAEKSVGNIDGAMSDFLELMKLPDANMEMRCMAEGDVVPMLIERAGRRFENGDIFGATEDCEALSSIDNAPPELKAKIEEGLKKLTMPGSVIIETDPEEAKISADGKARGTSPIIIDGLSRGTHEIVVSMEGYKDFATQVLAKPGSELKFPVIVLERKTGKLEIATNDKTAWTFACMPAGVTLEKTEGMGNFTFGKLPIGEYTVEFSREGWSKTCKTVAIEEGGDAKLSCEFSGGSAAICVKGEGATWEICALVNGVALTIIHGTSSTFISDFPPGVYIVKFNKAGWPQAKETLVIESGKASVIEYAFQSCRIEIKSAPAGAKITDSSGKIIGVTPFVMGDAQPGDVRYSIDLENYKTAHLCGTAAPGKTLALEASLERMVAIPEEGSKWNVPSCDMKMEWVARGSFIMGSLASESYRSDDETAHQATIARGFWIGGYEVTSAQWKAVMGTDSRASIGDDAKLPARSVTWNEAVEFCRRLTVLERAAGRLPKGYAYTLPTEAQWEYACRAGTATSYFFGDDGGQASDYGNTNGLVEIVESQPPVMPALSEDEAIARTVEHGGLAVPASVPKRTDRQDGYESASPVGSFKPNALGIFDMIGNVREWCLDNYGTYPDIPVEEPTGARNGTRKVCRGGSWKSYVKNCRSSARDSENPSARYEDVGLRVVLAATIIDASQNPRR